MDFRPDLIELLIQGLSLGVCQEAVAGLGGQFPSPSEKVGRAGQLSHGGTDKIIARLHIADRLCQGTDLGT